MNEGAAKEKLKSEHAEIVGSKDFLIFSKGQCHPQPFIISGILVLPYGNGYSVLDRAFFLSKR